MKVKKNIHAKALLLLSFACMLYACKKDDKDVSMPANSNDQELITTVRLVVSTDASPTDLKYFSYRDIDGDGGVPPKIDTIRLLENTAYTVRVLLLDETKTPIDTISNDIEATEKDAHQFFYSKLGMYDLTTTYLDFDDNSVPVGLRISINTGAGFTTKANKYKVVLKHQPGLKPKTGNGNANLGETDVEVDFPILIQGIQ